MSVTEKVKEIIAEHLGVPLSEVKPESKIVDDLGADSLDEVELLMNVEEEFDIEVDDETGEQVATVQDAIDLVTRLT